MVNSTRSLEKNSTNTLVKSSAINSSITQSSILGASPSFYTAFLFLFFILFSNSALCNYDTALKRLNEGDISGALIIWSKLADVGDMKAQYSAGILYEQQGENQSHQKAIHYLNLASQQGMNKAQYHLAMKYFSGYGVEQDFSKTIQLLLKAAAQDYPEAQYQLGRMAADGLGFKQDSTEAIRWYLLAAENGFGPAQHTLASHFMTGDGTAANIDKAVFWLKHASEQGNMLAQRDLGFLYTQGMGVEKSYAEAARLLKNPAEEGSPVSQYLLGQIYAEGDNGLEKSIRSAKYWFSEAIKSGYPKAEGALQQIAHIPSEPLQEETNVVDVESEEELNHAQELVELVNPEVETSEQEFYDFYNEDVSAYRESARKQDKKTTASIDDWAYSGDETIEMSTDNLIEYDDIDGQFDEAFASKAKSIGGRGNYKRLFGLAQDESDYKLREERNYKPELLNVAESNEKSHSKAIVFRGYSQSGEQQQLGFFSRKPVQTTQGVQTTKKVTTTHSSFKNSVPVNPGNPMNSSHYFTGTDIDKNDLNRFAKLSGDDFTLQILQSTDPGKAKQISQNKSGKTDSNLYVLAANKNNRPVYLVTYGTYSDRKKAENAAKSLPQYVALGTPWIRKVSKIQQQIQNL
ncbi:MAG: SPOR domain-containing protein [Gammaproteobacteria bacterium]|nr:SPOR domain-containing protein [Gammaproteobacteria bacterium]